MESTGNPTPGVSFDEVGELLSNLNLRVAALQQGPTADTDPAMTGVETGRNTVTDDNTLSRNNTGISPAE